MIAWCDIEQVDNNPFRWLGKYYRCEEYLFKGLEINPADDLARQTLLRWWTYSINYSVHHLPEGYIGEPFDDIKLCEKVKEQIKQLSTPELREFWTNELEEDLELVRNYIDWKTSGHPDFEKWGQENKKRIGYNWTRTYYHEK